MGGIAAAVVLGGCSCEHNDQVHRLVDVFAARAGPEAVEAERGLGSKPAAAPHPAADGGGGMVAWRDWHYHESIHERLPLSTPAPTTQ
jgi:hypothetical protein